MKPETSALLGQQVGNIRVVDVLGEGGMGAVYVGFDDKLQRKVALKAIRAEFRLHEEAKARFLREARILSQLDHPHICTVHDFIEGDDCDFLVLELVEGRGLRQAMKEGLDYSTKMSIARQLLEVLVAVHGQGVIHRDLKPENVMLTADGGTKVLDFGLARSIEEDMVAPSTAQTIGSDVVAPDLERDATLPGAEKSRSVYVKTRLGTLLGTAGYMSPEQARAEPATAASDMYSLGLILQEMFTGQAPFEPGLDAQQLIKRAARGETLPVTGVAADLRALIERMKALAQGARPSSLDALGQLQRIMERPKRVRRRRAFAAAWMILLLLCAALAVQSIRAVRGERRAEQEAVALRRAARFLAGMFEVMHPTRGGYDTPGMAILDDGARRAMEELSDEPTLQAQLMDSMGQVYCSLGLYEEAGPLLEEALRLRREHLPADHLDVAESLNSVSLLMEATGDYDTAERLSRDALAMHHRLLGDEHALVAADLGNLGRLLKTKGDFDAAEPLHREALAMLRRVVGDEHADVAASLNNLATLMRDRGDHDRAEALYRESVALQRKLFGDQHPHLASSLHNLAVLLLHKGDPDAAEPLCREALAMQRRIFGDEHPDVATGLDILAVALKTKGDLVGAEALYRQSLTMRRKLLGDEHTDVATSLNNLAALLKDKGDLTAAEPLFREALEIWRGLLGDKHVHVATSLNNLAVLLKERGDLTAAEPLLSEALEIFLEALPADHPYCQKVGERYASLLRELGRDAEAEELEARLTAAKAAAEDSEGDDG